MMGRAWRRRKRGSTNKGSPGGECKLHTLHTLPVLARSALVRTKASIAVAIGHTVLLRRANGEPTTRSGAHIARTRSSLRTALQQVMDRRRRATKWEASDLAELMHGMRERAGRGVHVMGMGKSAARLRLADALLRSLCCTSAVTLRLKHKLAFPQVPRPNGPGTRWRACASCGMLPRG